MEAVILAGGLGTRLRPCVENLPKPLAPVGGRPFIEYILDYLYNNGVCRSVISTGYMSEAIESSVGSAYRGMTVRYSREENPFGTGGAIKKSLSLCSDESIVVVNGDTFFDVDLFKMKKAHEASGCSITLAAKMLGNAERYGCLTAEGGRLTGFCEKGISASGLINGGVYFIKKNALDGVEEEKFSFEKRVLENKSFSTGVFESGGYFIDIGIPQDYRKAEAEKEKLVSRRIRRAVFLDRDGTLNEDAGHLYKSEDFRFLPGGERAVAEIKEKGYLAVVITNQAGIGKGYYTADDVDILHLFINSRLSEEARVIADGFYYCPHHKNAVIEKYRVECSCRKPKPGMILNAVSDFEKIGISIDIKNSFTVGNKISDVLAGKNAGTGKNILVGNDETDENGVADEKFDSLFEFSRKLTAAY